MRTFLVIFLVICGIAAWEWRTNQVAQEKKEATIEQRGEGSVHVEMPEMSLGDRVDTTIEVDGQKVRIKIDTK